MSLQADVLDADAIRSAVSSQLIGNRVVLLEETTSTNDVVRELAAEHAEGLVVIAERQTAGRGQYGRRWASEAGKGLWLSVLLRPNIAVAESSRLTDMLARAIANTIVDEIDVAAVIKPPNDVYISDRKVAGVLVEMRVEANGSYCAVAGLGINVNHSANDFPTELQDSAGSLATAAAHNIDRSAFVIAFLRKLDALYARL